MNKNEKKFPCGLQQYRMFAALLLSLALVACGGDSSSDSSGNDITEVAVQVELSAEQEVPTNTSSATASGTLTLNSVSGALSGSLTVDGMTTTSAHIHEGKAGTNGEVVITLDVDENMVTVPAETILTSTQIASMLAGEFYVNLHSEAFAEGEIRGQLAPSGVEVIVLDLNGASEVPPVLGAGSGTAYVTLNRTSSLLSISMATTTNTDASAAHLHSGFAGENGDPLLTLEQDSSDTSLFSVSGDVEQAVIDEIDAGGTYLNVHTAAIASGELRGQVLPTGVTVHTAMLSGTQEVPAVTSAGNGSGSLTLNSNSNTATAIVTTRYVDTATAVHVHSGAVDANGEVLFGLEKDADTAGLWVARDASVDAAAISSITSGNAYFNVHTPVNPDGEIRGQLSAN